MQPIVFPGLGLKFDIDPVAFNLFGIKDIYWYGIIMATAFVIAGWIAAKEVKRLNLNGDEITNLIIIATPIAIIGARLYYVVFYPGNYETFIDVIAIWRGGNAIYGAVIGALLTVIVYCRIKKISLWKVLDIFGLSFIIAQSIGRWGNFINQEAYGSQTNLPWRMEIFDYHFGKRISVHPTFLYESLWNLIGFIFLFWYRKRQKFHGEIFWMYIVWYGLGRLWIEGLRTDSLYLGPFRISQMVAIASVIVGTIFLIRNLSKLKESN